MRRWPSIRPTHFERQGHIPGNETWLSITFVTCLITLVDILCVSCYQCCYRVSVSCALVTLQCSEMLPNISQFWCVCIIWCGRACVLLYTYGLTGCSAAGISLTDEVLGCSVCRLLTLEDGEKNDNDEASEKQQEQNVKSEGVCACMCVCVCARVHAHALCVCECVCVCMLCVCVCVLCVCVCAYAFHLLLFFFLFFSKCVFCFLF